LDIQFLCAKLLNFVPFRYNPAPPKKVSLDKVHIFVYFAGMK
jgi:hypothetical protein